jgi:hypothetical protein
VRRLRRRKDGIEAIDENGRLDFRVLKGEEGFLFWGPVVWRGGPLAGGGIRKKDAQIKKRSAS